MGELLIKFNSSMFTNISKELFNTSIDIWVEPSKNREFEDGYNKSSILITSWSVFEFIDYYMQINLTFAEPLQISPLELRDNIKLNITNSTIFYSPTLNKTLHNDYWLLTD